MPFRMVSGVGQRMGVLDGGGDRRRASSSFWVRLGHPIVTSGDFATWLFPNYSEQDLFNIKYYYHGVQVCIPA